MIKLGNGAEIGFAPIGRGDVSLSVLQSASGTFVSFRLKPTEQVKWLQRIDGIRQELIDAMKVSKTMKRQPPTPGPASVFDKKGKKR